MWLAIVERISEQSNLLLGSCLAALGALVAILLGQRERNLQRLHDLRRDVYLPAVQASVEMLGTMAGIIDLRNAEGGYMQTSQQFASAIARVFMVASDDTIRKVARLQRACMREFFESLSLRQSLAKRQRHMDEINQARVAAQQELQRYDEMLKAINIDPSRDPGQVAGIGIQAKRVEQLIESHYATLAPLNDAHGAELIGHVRALPDRMEPLVDLYVEALTAIRAELKIGRRSEVLNDELRLNAVELRASLHQSIERLNALYGEPQQVTAG
jgi:hypothetical protein